MSAGQPKRRAARASPAPPTRRLVPVCYAESLPPGAGAEHVLGEQLMECFLAANPAPPSPASAARAKTPRPVTHSPTSALERAILQLVARRVASPSSRAGRALQMLQTMEVASHDGRTLAHDFQRVSSPPCSQPHLYTTRGQQHSLGQQHSRGQQHSPLPRKESSLAGSPRPVPEARSSTLLGMPRSPKPSPMPFLHRAAASPQSSPQKPAATSDLELEENAHH